jgi:lipopolysaccharide export LptBFGC system permease protein LptF
VYQVVHRDTGNWLKSGSLFLERRYGLNNTNLGIIIFYTLFSINSYAEMTILKKGDTAPFEGVLVDAPQMKEFRQINEDKKNLELQNLKLKDLALINEERVELYRVQSELLNKELSKAETRSFWKSIGYFALGVVVTGMAAKVAIESTR